MNIVAALDDPHLFQPWFKGHSWNGWRAILKAAFHLPMKKAEKLFLRSVAGRDPPKKRVRELWIIGGRRAGKDSIASAIAAHAAALFDGSKRLRPGERASVLCLACDRDQAKIVFKYTHAFFTEIDDLAQMLERETKDTLELSNNVDITIATNSFRLVRGRTILLAILDEIAFFRDENYANPDELVYKSLKPGMATLSESMLVGISSPYRKGGLLYQKFKDHYGKDDDEVLVIKAPTLTLNPSMDREFIEREIEKDPAAAAADYLAEFRDDIGNWISAELIESAVDVGVKVRAPIQNVRYYSFCDPSGGARDSFTCAITHAEKDQVFLDSLLEVKAPFSPASATRQVANLLKQYGLSSTTADRYAAGFSVDAFKDNGIKLKHSEENRSELYLEALPLFTAGRVRLLDNKRLVTQFAGLERKTSSLGKDQVNHPPGGGDDMCNAAAGALVHAANRSGPMKISDKVMSWASRPESAKLAAQILMRGSGRAFFGSSSER